MFGKLSNSKVRPSALGTTLNSSVYGSAVPMYFGRTAGGLKQIWAANFRKGSSGKKGKKAGKKGAPPTYVENVDFLIGSNPIPSPLRFWGNENDEYPLDFDVYSETRVAFAGTSFTIPDAAFYCLIAVTLTETYSLDVNDFGGPGAGTLTGTWERPYWNLAYAGPDYGQYSGMTNYPYCYKWQPGSGPTVEIPHLFAGAISGTFNFYYAKLRNGKVPTAQLRLTFEPVLGDGPEYSGHTDKQILYPHNAGLGSPNFDLGAGGAMPNLRGEFLGAYPFYKDGDCDFVDIIEDIFKSGLTQAGFGTDQNYSSIQRGLNCYGLPGVVQMALRDTVQSVNAIEMPLPITEGNFILVYTFGYFNSPTACHDTAGTVYTPLFNRALNSGFTPFISCWVGQAPASMAGNIVTVTDAGGNDSEIAVFEIAGVDTLESFTVNHEDASLAAGSITTAGVSGRQAYVFGLIAHNLNGVPYPTEAQTGFAQQLNGTYFKAFEKRIQFPGTFDINIPVVTATATETVLISFTNSQPVSYPRVFGNILHRDWLEQVRMQCRAYGLWGSLCMDSQKKASEWLQDLVDAAVCAPVWSGFSLKLIPRCEVSGAGNGAYYTAPTAAGPIRHLTPDHMIADSSGQCVTIEHTTPQVDDPNILQMQHPNRGSDYNDVVTAEPVAATIAQYGPRKQSPRNIRCIQDTAVARKVLSVSARRANFLRDTFKFTLQAREKLIECMDFYEISDPIIGLDRIPVIITSVEEDEKHAMKCEAEPFYYGLHLPGELEVTTPDPYKPNTGTVPADVNPPIFIEPVPALTPDQIQNQLWIAVSDPDAAYDGCQVMISTDGGTSYKPLGTIRGNCVTGELTADWPANADPDTTNDLLLDVSESLGEIDSVDVADEDKFVYPAYVEGGTADIPYELMSYATAVLTGANLYTLKATGSGNKLRRSVHDAPTAGAGVAHASGSRFALLDPAGSGILKVTLDPKWIGVTLFFKFLAFNSNGNGLQSAADVTAYSFTPTGTVGNYGDQVFLVDGSGPGDLGPLTIYNVNGHNSSASSKYNKDNFASNFTGVCITDASGGTAAVDPTKEDDSRNIAQPRHISQEDVKKLLPSHLSLTLGTGVHDQGWFGTPGHRPFGMNCTTPAWVKAAVDDKIRRGIKWESIYWAGPGSPTDGVAKLKQAYIATLPAGTFKYCIDVDHSALKRGSLTALITYLQSQFLSDAAYLKISGKPVIQFFDVQADLGAVAMAAAKAATTGSLAFWMPNGSGSRSDGWCDGAYDWPNPYTNGIHVDRYHTSHIGTFISQMEAAGKPYLVVHYKGFNGTLSKPGWSIGKDLPQDDGACWITVTDYNDTNLGANCIGAMIAGWNDYEEGTGVEGGIANNIAISASVLGNNLNFSVSGGTGDESTIAHYLVLATPTSDGKNLTALATVNVGVGTYDLTTAGLTPGTAYTLYVQVIGKPCFVCQLSAGVAYTA